MIEKPLWISHRGYKESAAENTVIAFRAAVDLGFSCLETDLRLTRDHRIVLFHDPTLKRLTGDQQRIQDMTSAELLDIKLENRKKMAGRISAGSDSFRTGHSLGQLNIVKRNKAQRPLFLDEFIAEFSGCRWVFDIKPETGAETIMELSRWSEAHGLVEKIISNAKILTWRVDHEALATARFPGIRFYARRQECWRAGLAMLAGQPGLGAIRAGRTYALPPTFMGLSLFQAAMVRRFHERDAAVVAFLPETYALARRAVTAGFDEILTNYTKGSTKRNGV